MKGSSDGLRMGEPGTDRIALDDIDRRIIALLTEDGRLSFREVARRLDGVSPRVVRYRIGRLQKKAVIRICAIVNPSTIGFPLTADVMVEVASGRQRAVAEQLARLENVGYVAGSIDDGELTITVYARDTDDLMGLVSGTISRIPGITRTRTIFVPWIVKDVHEWRPPASMG